MQLKDLDLNSVVAEKVSETEVKLTASMTLAYADLMKEYLAQEATLNSAKAQLAAQQQYVDEQQIILDKYVALAQYAQEQRVMETPTE